MGPRARAREEAASASRASGANDAFAGTVTTLRRLVAGLGAFGLSVVAGCSLEVRGDTVVDTVRLRDTLVRVETLIVRDSEAGTGASAPQEAAEVGAGGGLTPPGLPEASTPALPGATIPVPGSGLMVPVAGVSRDELSDTYAERRGSRRHEALDIPAPRGTPVVAAADGHVVKLFTSVAGGLTVYVADPSNRLIYYYAHLDRYRPGLREGEVVRMGTVLGAVGTTGNAPASAPHLHFAIGEMDASRAWYRTTPVNPLPFMRLTGAAVPR